MSVLATAVPAVLTGALPMSLTSAGVTTSAEAVLFWVLGPVMVLAALGLLFARKAVHAAMAVVVVMISLAFLYVAQDAPFLGVVQVVVYTGAIMMLFLFVLMLVGVDASDSLVETIRGQRWIGLLAGAGLGVVLVGVAVRATYPKAAGLQTPNADSNPVGIARTVFSDYAFALEVVGALLVIAALGALVLTHRQRLVPRIGQKERADSRVAKGERLTPLPAPGVYARHNAMDVPALDPRGNPIEESVSRVLRVRGQEQGPRVLARLGSAATGTLVESPHEDAPPPGAAPQGPPDALPVTRVDPATRTEEGL
ncbi:MAG TPA: NADH-quinone oxidoreductase subunit J [Demequina sp.]|nr:NADH-quinone oxidoreductase subunit J [Demequina sp.]